MTGSVVTAAAAERLGEGVDAHVKPVYGLKVWQEDDWWLARVIDASDGADRAPLNALTQARSLARIEPMGRDLIATILDADEDDFDVEVDYVLPDDAGQLVREAKRARAWLEAAQDVWQERSATAARALAEKGYSLRETAALLGLSHQRVDQILGGDIPAQRMVLWIVETKTYRGASASPRQLEPRGQSEVDAILVVRGPVDKAGQAFRDYAQATERLQERVAELAVSLSRGLEGAEPDSVRTK